MREDYTSTTKHCCMTFKVFIIVGDFIVVSAALPVYY